MTVGFLRPSEQQCITASHSPANNNLIIYENKNSQLATILSLQKGKEEKNKNIHTQWRWRLTTTIRLADKSFLHSSLKKPKWFYESHFLFHLKRQKILTSSSKVFVHCQGLSSLKLSTTMRCFVASQNIKLFFN